MNCFKLIIIAVVGYLSLRALFLGLVWIITLLGRGDGSEEITCADCGSTRGHSRVITGAEVRKNCMGCGKEI